jgi:hypothetical protein
VGFPPPSQHRIFIGLIARPLSVVSTRRCAPHRTSPHFLAALSIPMESRSGGLPLRTPEKQTEQSRGMSFMIIARHLAMTANRRGVVQARRAKSTQFLMRSYWKYLISVCIRGVDRFRTKGRQRVGSRWFMCVDDGEALFFNRPVAWICNFIVHPKHPQKIHWTSGQPCLSSLTAI